jgi:taurine dioxygenase
MGTMLRALIVPEIGGDTMFTSMSAAFEGLSDRLQQFVSGLEAVHDFKPFRQLFSGDAEGRRALRDFDERYPPATHPVVRLHPMSGRKVLFVNPNFTVAIEGMGESESHALLEQLYRQASVPEYQIRHQWRPHTLVFWDNRSVQHYAIHDFYPQRRKMERVTIKGDRSVGGGSRARRRVGAKPEVEPRCRRQAPVQQARTDGREGTRAGLRAASECSSRSDPCFWRAPPPIRRAF